MTDGSRYWAVIPAAGTGTRMQSDVPKQYLMINNRKVIEYVLDVFCAHEQIAGVMVALSAGDTTWKSLDISRHDKVTTTTGGKERYHSVLNCLDALDGMAQGNDWILVHDAARPCIRREDIDGLINTLSQHPVGGLLALPVRDTMKRATATGEVEQTVNRQNLWHALTPQMFRLDALRRAMQAAIRQGIQITDEAQAMELNGAAPLLIQGNPRNIKITQKDDLALAELYLDE